MKLLILFFWCDKQIRIENLFQITEKKTQIIRWNKIFRVFHKSRHSNLVSVFFSCFFLVLYIGVEFASHHMDQYKQWGFFFDGFMLIFDNVNQRSIWTVQIVNFDFNSKVVGEKYWVTGNGAQYQGEYIGNFTTCTENQLNKNQSKFSANLRREKRLTSTSKNDLQIDYPSMSLL